MYDEHEDYYKKKAEAFNRAAAERRAKRELKRQNKKARKRKSLFSVFVVLAVFLAFTATAATGILVLDWAMGLGITGPQFLGVFDRPPTRPERRPAPTPTMPAAGEPSPTPVITNFYGGGLELPVLGATGFAPIRVNVFDAVDANAAVLTSLEPGAAFLILLEQGDWWQIRTVCETTGWVLHDNCMINLPDVVPSLIFNNTNARASIFTASGVELPGITGERLYEGYGFNARLGRYEYTVAVMYSTAKRVYAAQQAALAQGRSLVIVEGFRPFTTQRLVFNTVRELEQENEVVRRGLNYGPWHVGWFISSGISTHQRGTAIDATLARVYGYEHIFIGGYTVRYITESRTYHMPTEPHNLTAAAAVFERPIQTSLTGWIGQPLSDGMNASEPAQALQNFFTEAGFVPLASEWWHFDDLHSDGRVRRTGSNGNYYLAEIVSVSPTEVGRHE